jgi:hypothetical protein
LSKLGSFARPASRPGLDHLHARIGLGGIVSVERVRAHTASHKSSGRLTRSQPIKLKSVEVPVRGKPGEIDGSDDCAARISGCRFQARRSSDGSRAAEAAARARALAAHPLARPARS